MRHLAGITVVFLLLIYFLPITDIYARSGCCSHHSGVCGCGCCDGTPLSTTCAPYYPECSQPVYIAPTATKVPISNTPTPSTPKPTILPIQTPTVKPTLSPSLEPEVKSVTTENTPNPTVRPDKSEVSSSDVLIFLGVFAAVIGGLIWIIRKIIKKIINIFRK